MGIWYKSTRKMRADHRVNSVAVGLSMEKVYTRFVQMALPAQPEDTKWVFKSPAKIPWESHKKPHAGRIVVIVQKEDSGC